MSDPSFDPQAYVAALKREREGLERQEYPKDREHIKERRLAEIDDQIKQYDDSAERGPARGRRQRAVTED